MKFAICNEIFQTWALEKVFAYAGKLGYDAVEIAPFTLANSVTDISATERKRLRESAERSGIQIAGIHWLLVKPEGFYIDHPDPAIRHRTAEYFVPTGGLLRRFGWHPDDPRARLNNETFCRTFHSNRLGTGRSKLVRQAVARAEARQVTICFEPLGPAETNFINAAEEAIKLVQQVASAYLKMLLDMKAMSSEAKPIRGIIWGSSPHFAHFHANDPNLKGPGFGKVDFRPIAAALKEVGYNGFVSVEVFKFDEGPEVIASKSLWSLKEVFA